ncbi:4F2 cell-surface antigen heavy chain isoform X2 [Hyalella azteca]|uniref:4F2 cell-surface antigen heavy chain isoform X2 n=1 Tax=Hyalella azteca TaxID=294128 RepID=A0A979FPV9_HYAAZ|nr:4F2 cell-surface antigen heavy chain isoform X2 [Hyalella azteca]
MGEEKDGVPNGEMAPQEESSKVLLNEGADGAKAEVQAADIKVDIATEDEFRGLTKSELMKYAKDPFWVRLRIILMFLFWAAWVAMLVLAIWIIVKAPACEPPPTITWMQESAMVEVNPSAMDPQDSVNLVKALGLSSFYIPALISGHDFYKLNPAYVAEQVTSLLQVHDEQVTSLLQALTGAGVHGVTDFVPSPVLPYNSWVVNTSYAHLFNLPALTLNYDEEDLSPELQKVLIFWKNEYNITGFTVPADETEKQPELHNLTTSLNHDLADQDIVVGEGMVDVSDAVSNLNLPGSFQQFLKLNSDSWPYYKFMPVVADHRTASPAQMPAVTMALMLSPGTPILQIPGNNTEKFVTSLGGVVAACSELRSKDAFKFGATEFVNSTANVVAFTRTMKGTPGYAVVSNLAHEDVLLDFSILPAVPSTGTLVYNLTSGEVPPSNKVDLTSVLVEGHGGAVIEFVAQDH